MLYIGFANFIRSFYDTLQQNLAMLPYTTYNIPENGELIPSHSNKWLWVIVDKSLSDQDNDLLEKISGALKADFHKDAFCLQINSDQSISLADNNDAKPRLIISFGVSPAALGIWIDLSKSGLVTLEHFSFILTSGLGALSASPAAKKELWQCMQVFMEKK